MRAEIALDDVAGNIWQALPRRPASAALHDVSARRSGSVRRNHTWYQWLTLVHFSAQRKHFLWDRGRIQGSFTEWSGGVRGCLGCVFVTERLRLS
jgi:hypothetical protein